MKRLLLASTFLFAAIGVASAADAIGVDAAQPAGFVWSGGYVGLQGGYAWGNSRHYTDATPAGTDRFNMDGFVGGVTVGYNYQVGQAVLGIEGDISYANIKGTTGTTGSWTCDAGCTTEVNWYGTARARLGLAMDNTLPYITGGVAFGGVKSGPESTGDGGDSTRVGWTVGAGIEHALNQNWTLKAEYLYVDLGRIELTDFGPPYGQGYADAAFNTVRLGLNYKF